MGKQARLRHQRREERSLAQRFTGPPVPGEPQRILRSLHRDIQNHCGENSRRCWEYLLEMLAHSTGWRTETAESRHLWERFANETRFEDFIASWYREVHHAKQTGAAFSEPLGELLEEIEGTNANLGQFFTPMAVVRMTNSITLQGLDEGVRHPNGVPAYRGIDPCCGTGRFILDALVHHDNLLMHGVDRDIWMVRCALLNVRLLARWTSLRITNRADLLRPLRQAEDMIRRLEEVIGAEGADTSRDLEPLRHDLSPEQNDGPADLIIGGRAIFIHGDSLVVDLDHTPNWLCAGWAWKPHPWETNLKMAGYPGTYQDWIEAGRPTPDQIEAQLRSEVQFDYAMAR